MNSHHNKAQTQAQEHNHHQHTIHSLMSTISQNYQLAPYQKLDQHQHIFLHKKHQHSMYKEEAGNQLERQVNNNNFFQSQASNKLYSKLDELEQKTSRIISKLPNIHLKMTKNHNKHNNISQLLFTSQPSSFSNKLKIIRQLQDKVQLLQSNINNPHVSSEEMLTIEKQINLNFQNYYHESKENNEFDEQNQEICLESSFDSQKSKFERKKQKIIQVQVQVIVYVPKFIQIEVPYQLITFRNPKNNHPITQTYQYQINQPLQNEHENKESSMQIIINKFHQNYQNHFKFNIQDNHSMKISDIEPHLIYSDQEKDQFSLPLQSMQKNRLQYPFNDKLNLFKRTDRSTKSSNQEAQKIRDQIWNKEYIQFNHQNLSQVKEYEHRSQQNDKKSYKDDLQCLNIDINTLQQQQKLNKIQLQNKVLSQKYTTILIQNNTLKQQLKQLQQKMIQLQIEYLQQIQKKQQKQHEYTYLLIDNYKYKQQLQKKQHDINQYQIKINNIQKEYNNKLEDKQNDLHDLLKVLNQRSQELEMQIRINEQMKNILTTKQKQSNQHIHELQYKLHQYKDQILFYKHKIQQDDICINQQQHYYLKTLNYQDKKQYQQQKINKIIKEIQIKYMGVINQVQLQNRRLEKQLNQIKGLHFSIVNNTVCHEVKQKLQKDLQNLYDLYQIKLLRKYQEIQQLNKQFQNYIQDKNMKNEQQIKKISTIKNVFNNNQNKKQDIQFNFIYIFDKLINRIKFQQFLYGKQKQQKTKLSKKISKLNLYINQQIQKVQFRMNKTQKQNQQYKNNINQLKKQIKRLNIALKVYSDKIVDNNVAQPMFTVHQLENQILVIQNCRIKDKIKKLKQYTLNLENKLINDILNQGQSLCQHLCQMKNKTLELKNQQDNTQITLQEKLNEIKLYYSQSYINPSLSDIQLFSQSKINQLHLSIHSNNISFISKPKKNINAQTMKALFAPLPIISLPTKKNHQKISIFLDKMIVKHKFMSDHQKKDLTFKLLNLGIQLVKVSKKLFSLKPSQILVNICDKQFGNGISEEDQNHLIYRAPEVLLGFNQTESSYVWSIGLIIDQIYHQKIFYHKINDVLSRKNNYKVRNEELNIGSLLLKMLNKNSKQRPSLTSIKEEFAQLIEY